MKKLSEIFNISYGNQFDLNKMILLEKWRDDAAYFISRTSKSLGVSAIVKQLPDVKPYPDGLITVALGGSILSSFIQQKPFYTAQNIMVLSPREKLSFQEKLFYCICIEKNRFRYSSFGREANRTLKNIKVPDHVPEWSKNLSIPDYKNISMCLSEENVNLHDKKWKWFKYEELFDIKKGKRITNKQMKSGKVPCIRPIEINNGVYKYIDIKPNHNENTITVNYNGSIGEAFYQPKPYFALDDVNILYPKFGLNPFIAMFVIPLIRKERFRYSYGRKWHLGRMKSSLIKLPVTEKEKPDWAFMEGFIKKLPYSKYLLN